MRKDYFGSPNFQPVDTLEDIRNETGIGDVEYAYYNAEPDETYLWNGELQGDFDPIAFEGFETKEAMMAWLVYEIGLTPSDIEEQ